MANDADDGRSFEVWHSCAKSAADNHCGDAMTNISTGFGLCMAAAAATAQATPTIVWYQDFARNFSSSDWPASHDEANRDELPAPRCFPPGK